MSRESGLRDRIRQALRREFTRYGAKIVGQPANAWTGPGRTDTYVLVRGVHVDLEIKTPTGEPTPRQLDNIITTREAGGYAWIVRSPEAAVGAVWAALRGEPMSGDFDFLFDDSPPQPAEEIRAFQERNGHVPAGDGASVEPPEDYTLHSVKAQLDRVERLLVLLLEATGQKETAATSAEIAALLEEPAEPSPPAPEPPPKSRRRRPAG